MEKKGRACVTAEAAQPAHPAKRYGVPNSATMPPRPGSQSLCCSRETKQAVRGSVVANAQDVPFPTAQLALREGGVLWQEGVPHLTAWPHLALTQGAASVADTFSSSRLSSRLLTEDRQSDPA